MQPNHLLEQDDHDLQWLAREAPQFHTSAEVPRNPYSYSATHDRDDASDASSDHESAGSGSDSDDDPYHPYNFQDNSKKWVRDGDYVYAADNLQDSFLAANNHIDEAPYVPPSAPTKGKDQRLFIAPDEFAPFEPYIYRDVAPQQQPQTLSPHELTSSLPSSPRPASPAPESPRTRRARAHSHRGAGRSAHDHSHAYSPASDGEADTSSGDDASEDEYVPSPRVRSRKLPSTTRIQPQGRAKLPRASYSPYPSSSTSTSAAESSSAANSRRPGSRNVQIIDQVPPPRGSWPKTGPDAYRCPYCDHVQKNKRSPDMERHIRSHFRRTTQAQWVCCGLPLEEAAALGRGRNDNPWFFNGVLMVGGCHEDFSRMDALKRHWRNGNNHCIGEVRYSRVKDEPSQ